MCSNCYSLDFYITIILCYTILHYAILCYTMVHHPLVFYTILYYTMLYYATLCYATLHYATLRYATPHHTTSHHTRTTIWRASCVLNCKSIKSNHLFYFVPLYNNWQPCFTYLNWLITTHHHKWSSYSGVGKWFQIKRSLLSWSPFKIVKHLPLKRILNTFEIVWT